MALAWPTSVLKQTSAMWARKSLSRSGGDNINGLVQVMQSSSEHWIATIGFRIRNSQQILAFRALQAQQWGRAAEWILPACPKIGVPPNPPSMSADYSWSDDWSIDFSIGPAPLIPPGEGGLVTSLAARGARTITFRMHDPNFAPLPGQYFSIGDRLYCIGTVTADGDQTFTVTFAPGLRAAAAVDAFVEFTSPRCLMRLASDNEGQLDLDQLRFSEQRINFVEAF